MTDVIIYRAKRTAIGKLGGSLSNVPVQILAKTCIEAVIEESYPFIKKEDIDDVIFGNVLSAGCGMNVARQASLAAGLPPSTTGTTVNMVCGSGLKAIITGALSIKSGDAAVVVAGGMESMSRAPHLVRLRYSAQKETLQSIPPMLPLLPKFGDMSLVDSLVNDGLTDPNLGWRMGDTAEYVAQKFKISRENQDNFALRSHRLWTEASKRHNFDCEIATVKPDPSVSDGVNIDELPRPNLTIEQLAKLRVVFEIPPKSSKSTFNGTISNQPCTITAGNCSGMNDGAAAVILTSSSFLKQADPCGTGMARLVSWSHSGGPPELMGIEPIGSVKIALARAGWTVDDVDLWEINEAFAATTIVVINELGIKNWTEKVNLKGGAIAIGHPVGASAARLVVTLSHQLAELQDKNPSRVYRGVATVCIGGGQGIAACLESIPKNSSQ